MSNETAKNETATVVPIVATRTKSPETVLKQEMRSINKELDAIAKTVANFADAKKEFDSAEARKGQLENKLAAVKGKLRVALGLD